MTDSATAGSRETRLGWWAAATSAAITAVGVGLVWSVRGSLPDPIATHWGPRGQADGFSSLPTVILGQVLLGLGMPLVLLLLGAALKSVRELAVLAVGLGAFCSTLVTASVWGQRGLAQASGSRLGPELLAGLLVGTVVSVVWWAASRRRGPLPTAARPVSAPPGVVWAGELRRGGGNWLVAAGIGLVLVVAGVFSWFAMWWLTASMLLVAALLAFLASVLFATVTIDAHGVQVRSLGVVRWASVPLATIEDAGVVRVEGLGDYGGFGLRKGFDGSTALVTASGEALKVRRVGLPAYVLTVADPHAAAGTLQQLLGVEQQTRAAPEGDPRAADDPGDQLR